MNVNVPAAVKASRLTAEEAANNLREFSRALNAVLPTADDIARNITDHARALRLPTPPKV